jgi:hypothetical protein
VLKNAGVHAPAFFFSAGFSFFLNAEDSKFHYMKRIWSYLLILLLIIPEAAECINYDINLSIESPWQEYGHRIGHGLVIRPGITLYPGKAPWYTGTDFSLGSNAWDLMVYGGFYTSLSSLGIQPEWSLGWWGRTDSLTSSLKCTISHISPFRWQFTADVDPLAGRIYGYGEIQWPVDWKIPWILSVYSGLNLSSYQQGPVYRKSGLSEAGIGIATWMEIGSWYGELSLRSGPGFDRFQIERFQVFCRFMMIRRGG